MFSPTRQPSWMDHFRVPCGLPHTLISECSTTCKHYVMFPKIARSFLKITIGFFQPQNFNIGKVFEKFQQQNLHSHWMVYSQHSSSVASRLCFPWKNSSHGRLRRANCVKMATRKRARRVEVFDHNLQHSARLKAERIRPKSLEKIDR